MLRALLTVTITAAVAGCASPFNDRSTTGLSDELRGQLPAWVMDEWEDQASRQQGNEALEGGASSQPLSLDELIQWALEYHPAVQASEARWHAARQRIAQARTLPDPELSYRIQVEQIDTDQGPIGHAVGISQMFPWFGTLDRAASVRDAEARAVAQRYVQQQLEVVSAIKSAWAEYAYLHEAADIYREQLDLLRQMEPVVRMRFRTGEVGQRDLVRVEAEIDRVDNDLRDVQELIVAAAAQVNAAAGRSARASLPAGEDARMLRNGRGELSLDPDILLDAIARLNPDLERLRHELAARRHSKDLADKRFYPAIMVGVEYGLNTSKRMAGMDGGGSDMLMGMIGLRLPIWRESYEAGSREALAEWGATLRELDDRQNRLEAELKMTLYAIRDAERRTNLFGDRLRIRAEQVLESTITAYRAGEASFTDLIEAQRELLEFSLSARRAEADRFGQMARLEALTGKSITPNDHAGEGHDLQENRP